MQHVNLLRLNLHPFVFKLLPFQLLLLQQFLHDHHLLGMAQAWLGLWLILLTPQQSFIQQLLHQLLTFLKVDELLLQLQQQFKYVLHQHLQLDFLLLLLQLFLFQLLHLSIFSIFFLLMTFYSTLYLLEVKNLQRQQEQLLVEQLLFKQVSFLFFYLQPFQLLSLLKIQLNVLL